MDRRHLEPAPHEAPRSTVRMRAWIDTPATVRWISAEPLLGPVDLDRTDKDALVDGGLDWVVAGGESGPHHRPLDLNWVRSLRDQCVDAGVPFLFKQVGGRTSKAGGRQLDGRTWDEYPSAPKTDYAQETKT